VAQNKTLKTHIPVNDVCVCVYIVLCVHTRARTHTHIYTAISVLFRFRVEAKEDGNSRIQTARRWLVIQEFRLKQLPNLLFTVHQQKALSHTRAQFYPFAAIAHGPILKGIYE